MGEIKNPIPCCATEWATRFPSARSTSASHLSHLENQPFFLSLLRQHCLNFLAAAAGTRLIAAGLFLLFLDRIDGLGKRRLILAGHVLQMTLLGLALPLVATLKLIRTLSHDCSPIPTAHAGSWGCVYCFLIPRRPVQLMTESYSLTPARPMRQVHRLMSHRSGQKTDPATRRAVLFDTRNPLACVWQLSAISVQPDKPSASGSVLGCWPLATQHPQPECRRGCRHPVCFCSRGAAS